MISSLFENNQASILIWEMTESIDEIQAMLLQPELFTDDYSALTNDKRRREFLASRLALSKLFGKEVKIEYKTDGKPYIPHEETQISITHSGKWIAVMAHPTRICGIDLECRTEKFRKLYKRFLNPDEQKYLFDETDLTKVQLAWSAKEALFKIIGNEAVDFANHLHIEPFNTEYLALKAIHIPSNQMFSLNFISTPEYNLVYGMG